MIRYGENHEIVIETGDVKITIVPIQKHAIEKENDSSLAEAIPKASMNSPRQGARREIVESYSPPTPEQTVNTFSSCASVQPIPQSHLPSSRQSVPMAPLSTMRGSRRRGVQQQAHRAVTPVPRVQKSSYQPMTPRATPFPQQAPSTDSRSIPPLHNPSLTAYEAAAEKGPHFEYLQLARLGSPVQSARQGWLTCPHCKMEYSNEFACVQHMIEHSDFMPYKCTQCTFQAKLSSELISHEQSMGHE